MHEAKRVIEFLLDSCDAKNKVIEDLNKQLAALKTPQTETSVPKSRRRSLVPAPAPIA